MPYKIIFENLVLSHQIQNRGSPLDFNSNAFLGSVILLGSLHLPEWDCNHILINTQSIPVPISETVLIYYFRKFDQLFFVISVLFFFRGSNIDRTKPIWSDVVTSRHCVGFFGERPNLTDLEPHSGSSRII